MSAFAEKIKSHYAGLPMGTIEVPEWDLTVYVKPATVGQSARIRKEDDQYRQGCRMLQVRCRKQDGFPLFDDQDFDAMITHGDMSVVTRLVDDILALDPEEGEVKKP